MFTVKLLAFMVVAVSLQHLAEATPKVCAGCPVEVDPNREDIKKSLAHVMAAKNSPDELVRIIKASTQVVNGIKYKVVFEVKNPSTNQVKICKTAYVSRPWEYEGYNVLEFGCKA
uniref:Cystatin Pr15a n=1 Tax=Platymeris rhadamanthus TaxID=1134088 RepID=CYS15_PLARH|nr:RecName: Full=Cystatin Pr15a; AltName: Full=Venom cystatin domain peptide Pr15a; Flags: Precursor [Platymeris rhadamanthus]QHB21501.1 venom cystatin domain peptide Pr15a [Platymeris rhadamanthus]